jgi:fatty-acyl-CoA synthase
MAHLFRFVADRHPACPAIAADGATLSFADLDRRSDRVARALQRQGVGSGDIVATLLLDGIPLVELLIATAKLGAAILPLNWRLAAPELGYILSDSAPALCFVSQSLADLARRADPLRAYVQLADHDPDALATLAGRPAEPSELPIRGQATPDTPWYMVYTSGTTGWPKGCQHSQRGYVEHALAMRRQLGSSETDRLLLTAPLFHVSGLHLWLGLYTGGGCAVVPPLRLDIAATLRFAAEYAITIQSLPILEPAGYVELQRQERLPLALRLIVGGGGSHAPQFLETVREVLKVDMLLGYGQSEQGGFTLLHSLASQLRWPTACGRPIAPMEARIVDDAGNDLPDDTVGELVVRGPGVMLGYLNQPVATSEAMQEGWLRTGDLFRRDADGLFHFAGRQKELIKSGGENVYPAEVERAIGTHPAVADCCVAGVRDPRFGEVVKAFVVLHRGCSLTLAEIANWCRSSIAGYKRPRLVEFVDAIPRNFQGKPQRHLLSARPVESVQAADRSAPTMRGEGNI